MGSSPHLGIIGGGAAGFFAAIVAAEASPEAVVEIFEATAHPLAKVRVSGGGRCNATHACFEPRELARRYPRGGRELLGAFTRWQPRDMVAWFAQRGVELKTEADGRMFPTTDDSATIADCLLEAARRAGVRVHLQRGVESATRHPDSTFSLRCTDGSTSTCHRLLIATGGNKSSRGLAIATTFGHTIEPPVPSLFTFQIKDARLEGLSGLAVESAEASVPDLKLNERGPVLITHWGLSGPAVLRLSAWGARLLHDCSYQFTLLLNWTPDFSEGDLLTALTEARAAHPKKQIGSWCPVSLPLRLWEKLVAAAGLAAATTWAGTGNGALRALVAQIRRSEFRVTGKSLFKEEFVTCGGVRLGEVDFRTMESRHMSGLHFAGEVLDVDGITGGFNFQAAWTTGWLAGNAMAAQRS